VERQVACNKYALQARGSCGGAPAFTPAMAPRVPYGLDALYWGALTKCGGVRAQDVWVLWTSMQP